MWRPRKGTTIGEVRSLAVGAGYRPAPNAFPGHADAEPAAWCWTKGGVDHADDGLSFTCWAVVPGEPPVRIIAMSGITAAPTGAPVTK